MERIRFVGIVIILGLIAVRWIGERSGRFKILRHAVLLIYILGILYFTLFSRQPSAGQRVNVFLFEPVIRSLKRPFSWERFFKAVLSGRYGEVLNNTKPLLTGVLNIMLFVPMGYIFPLYSGGRSKAGTVAAVSLVCSLLIETVQIIFQLGYFDIDDIFCNVTGSILGLLLYMALGKLIQIWRRASERQKHCGGSGEKSL